MQVWNCGMRLRTDFWMCEQNTVDSRKCRHNTFSRHGIQKKSQSLIAYRCRIFLKTKSALWVENETTCDAWFELDSNAHPSEPTEHSRLRWRSCQQRDSQPLLAAFERKQRSDILEERNPIWALSREKSSRLRWFHSWSHPLLAGKAATVEG